MNQKQELIIAEFRSTLEDLDAVLGNVPDEGLDWAEEGEWSIREILHHLAEDCNVYAFIIERALATPDCKVFFGEFPGNQEWGKQLGFSERPIDNALDLMHAHRKFLAELVSHFPDRWENKVNYYNIEGEKIADRTVRDMILMLTEHMQEHTEMIQKVITSQSNE